MKEQSFGWSGKILKVDLSDGRITHLDTMAYADRFLGGRGIATRLYWEGVSPDTGALEPGNRLIFMTGPLVATGVQGASRFEVVGKSPMTLPEGFCYGNLGGFFGPALKRAGYDGIVVEGRAESPCYIWIKDGKAELRDGRDLWKKGTKETMAILRETHGSGTRVVTTGPAGENLCRGATLVTDHHGSATGGFGAVMGSKNLKAVAVLGTGRPLVARREELIALNRWTVRLSQRGTLRMPLPRDRIRYAGKASCYQCGLDCLRGLFRTSSGREAVGKCHSLIFYMPWVTRTPGEPIETALDATELCNDLSLCTMEMDNVIKWIRRCHEAGYLGERETELDASTIGTKGFVERLVTMIAHRQGFGDLLAEGLLRAGQKLGQEALAHFSEEVSGVGKGDSYSPREYVVNALLYAFEPRQPIAMLHEVSYLIARWLLHRIRPDLSPTTSEVFRAAATRFWGSDKAWDMTTYEGKALAAVRIQDRTYVKDSLLLCDCAWPIMDSFHTPDHVGDPQLEARLFTAVTGIDTDEASLNLYGERIFNLQRAILLREGWRARDWDAPAAFNFTEPIQMDPLNPQLIVPGDGEEPVSVRGNVLDLKKFEEMREEFYTLRGWDPMTGLQRFATLQRLGLEDLAEGLSSRGLLITS